MRIYKLANTHTTHMHTRARTHNQGVTVLLLDEVGLAELSPDLPLKSLHAVCVCVCVCVCVRVCVCMHVSMYVCMCVCVCV